MGAVALSGGRRCRPKRTRLFGVSASGELAIASGSGTRRSKIAILRSPALAQADARCELPDSERVVPRRRHAEPLVSARTRTRGGRRWRCRCGVVMNERAGSHGDALGEKSSR